MALRRRCITIHVDRRWGRIQENSGKMLAHPDMSVNMMSEPTKKTTGAPRFVVFLFGVASYVIRSRRRFFALAG